MKYCLEYLHYAAYVKPLINSLSPNHPCSLNLPRSAAAVAADIVEQ
jgi:hypothetical protein